MLIKRFLIFTVLVVVPLGLFSLEVQKVSRLSQFCGGQTVVGIEGNSSVATGFRVQGNPFYRGNSPDKNRPRLAPNRLTAKITKIQRFLKAKLYRYIKMIKSGSLKYLFASIFFAFIYGIVHAAGPGHRKIVLFSYFSSHKHKFSTIFSAGFLSAGIHAISAVFITVVIFLSVKRAASLYLDRASTITELITWGFIIIFGIIMLIVALVEFIKKIRNKESELPQTSTNSNKRNRSLWGLIAVTSIVPCPAASMIMIVTLQQNIWWLGILLIIGMSLGMGITVSLTSIPALFSNRGLNKIGGKFGKKSGYIVELIMESAGAFVMIILGLIMVSPLFF